MPTCRNKNGQPELWKLPTDYKPLEALVKQSSSQHEMVAQDLSGAELRMMANMLRANGYKVTNKNKKRR